MPWQGDWADAQIQQAAWEYNLEPSLIEGTATEIRPFLETSKNIIVEALYRENGHVVVRFVEAFGVAGEAKLKLKLPHTRAIQTDMIGRKSRPLPAGPEYRIPLRAADCDASFPDKYKSRRAESDHILGCICAAAKTSRAALVRSITGWASAVWSLNRESQVLYIQRSEPKCRGNLLRRMLNGGNEFLLSPSLVPP